MTQPQTTSPSGPKDKVASMSKRPLFHLTHINHFYQGMPVLQIEKLVIREKSIVGLMGPNGSGKTTLLKILALAIKPTQGEILYNGKAAEPFSPDVRHRVSLLPQEPYLMKRSVYDNMLYGLKIRGEKTDPEDKIAQALSWVGLSADRVLKRKWYALSGGEIQRVALAARLVLRPAVLLLDEPTTNVDADSALLIRQAALRAKDQWGTTLIIASHDWPWLYEVSDEVLHLYKGRLYGTEMENIISGPWQEYENPYWGKVLRDGQRVLVPKPSSSDAMALVQFQPDFDAKETSKHQSDTHFLSGAITRLIHDHNTGDVIATIGIGELSVFIRCSRKEILEWKRIPGDQITLAYEIASVRWL